MNSRESFVDLYEALQISPGADVETIHRVYRLLALRYHPDNRETGNPHEFELVLRAYRILSDPEQRAAYDAQYHQHQKLRWKIFDQGGALNAREIEKRQRRGVLSLLYTKRLQQTQKPGMSLREMENLLACAREHLEFTLWYLREKGLVQTGDNGQYWITAAGVDACNEMEVSTLREDRLLGPGKNPANGSTGETKTEQQDPTNPFREPQRTPSQHFSSSTRPTSPPRAPSDKSPSSLSKHSETIRTSRG